MKLILIVLFALIAISAAAKKKGGAKVGPCDAKKLEYTKKKADAAGSLGLEEPRCDNKTGNFLGMQYIGTTAYCVTKNGITIDGYTVNRGETGPDMNCQCARDRYDYQKTGLLGKMHFCDTNGNYAKIGCSGSVCYCQSKKGKKVGKKQVPIHQKALLKCD